MRITSFLFSFFLLLPLSAHAQEMLSANVNKIAMGVDYCERQDNNLNRANCKCMWTQSLHTDISQVDLLNFVGNETKKLSDKKLRSLKGLVDTCRSGVIPYASVADGELDSVVPTAPPITSAAPTSRAKAQCAQPGGHADRGGLAPRPNMKAYTRNQISFFLDHCPGLMKRDLPYCACVASKMWPYVDLADFEALTAGVGLALATVDNLQCKMQLLDIVKAECEAEYSGKRYSKSGGREYFNQKTALVVRPTEQPLRSAPQEIRIR